MGGLSESRFGTAGERHPRRHLGQFGFECFCVNRDGSQSLPRRQIQSHQPGHKAILGFVSPSLKDLGNAWDSSPANRPRGECRGFRVDIDSA